MAGELNLPNEWEARHYQTPLFNHMFQGGLEGKRAAEVWHRRGGKDSCCLNLSAVASQMRVGTIWHMLPTLKQGRRVIWDGIDKYGRRMIDQAFPKEMRAANGINNADMQLRFANGSIYQVVGSDNYDSLVGTNPVGIIFSEWSIADPAAWDYIRPILAENNGWALFIYTPRGKNHGFKLHESFEKLAAKNPKYHASILTVRDTTYPDGRPIISEEIIQEEREAGMSEEKIQQEFYCSWDAGLEGAFFSKELALAEKEGRIGDFPHNPAKTVQTAWDIGFRDKNCIGFTQRHESGAPIFIDYMEGRNKSLIDWIREVRSLPYDYDYHYGPHDLEQHEYGSGMTRIEIAQGLDFNFDVVEKLFVQDGIEQVRRMLRVGYFNRPLVERMLDGLYSYRREFDERLNLFRDKPVHDWSSHPADMVRYLSTAWDYDRPTSGISNTRFRAVRSVGNNHLINDQNPRVMRAGR